MSAGGMESVLTAVEEGNEDAIYENLLSFNEKNKTNLKLSDGGSTRETFCSTILDGLSSGRWLPRTQAAALTSLRITAREKEGVEKLKTNEGLRTVVKLADLSHDTKESCFHGDVVPRERFEVIVEGVKCLCNLVLTNHSLTTTCADLGVLHGLSLRLRLVRNMDLPPDILTFDLRLLFLITACGMAERSKFREEYAGLYLLVNILDALMFGSEPLQTGVGGQKVVAMEKRDEDVVTTETEGETTAKSSDETKTMNPISSESEGSDEVRERCKYLVPLPPVRDDVHVLTTPLSDEILRCVSEAMKVVFNQTVHWKEEDELTEDEVELFARVVVLVRIFLVSVPFQLSKITMDTVIHCVEVLVNAPLVSAKQLLLPAKLQIMPTLQQLYPSLFPHNTASGGATNCEDARDENDVCKFDEIYQKWNMSCCACLLQLLIHSLDNSSTAIATVLNVLRNISKGHQAIRKYFKNKILPPLREVTQRPELELSLKGRLVRLMTASGGQGAEGVAAEFLFVLCKEDSSRLIKYTGYGNAAGLLLTHGLLGGGKSATAGDYSSDSDSDTESYVNSKPSIDPVTGGPSVEREEGEGEGEGERGAMTDEEKEREAGKLVEMMRKLNEQGVIRILPMDNQQKDILSENDVDIPLD